MDKVTLRRWALELGFGDAALCDASVFAREREIVASQPLLLERRQLRFDPVEDAPRTRSLAVLVWPYTQERAATGRQLFVDSYYAASNQAYHAARLLEQRMSEAGLFAKANVSYPAREAAVRAGLGIVGHNGLLIHPVFGTRVVIILMATEIKPEAKALDAKGKTCLQCGRCAKACPSGAIDESGMAHPQRCLRNFMMEGVIAPEEAREKIGNRLLGCDICQRVCPMQPEGEQESAVWRLDDLLTTDEKLFSAQVARLGDIIGRNAARPQRVRAQAALLCGNVGTADDLPVLRVWANSPFEAVRAHAAWAIERIESKLGEDNCPRMSGGLDQNA